MVCMVEANSQSVVNGKRVLNKTDRNQSAQARAIADNDMSGTTINKNSSKSIEVVMKNIKEKYISPSAKSLTEICFHIVVKIKNVSVKRDI